MIFSKALLAKGLGSLAMIGTGSLGILSTKVYLDNKLTRFDQGLIDHLSNEGGGDIEFSVKEGTSDISSGFPNFSSSTEPKKTTVSIKVSINSNGGGTGEGTITEKDGADSNESLGSKKYLQKLNGDGSGDGTAWTWSCEITFNKKSEDTSANELKDKEKLVKDSTEKGFFNKLKEKKTENKPLKQRFIRRCAEERGFRKNWEISGASSLTGNKIESTKEFNLIKGDSIGKTDDDASKLFPENDKKFKEWFEIT